MKRLAFEFVPFNSTGTGALRFPIDAWRVTFCFVAVGLNSYDGALLDNSSSSSSGVSIITVGGVIIDGEPVPIDQTLLLGINDAKTAGFMVLERFVDA